MTADGITLLTGASGFVGSAVARALTGRGERVRALVRRTSRTAHLDGLGIEFAHGDLRDATSVRRAMKGVERLYHVAADYRLWARQPAELMATNVDGTRTIMEEAMRAGLERIVYTSSVATLASQPDRRPANESCRIEAAQAVGTYKRSKVIAERLVEILIERGLPAVIVHPSTPVGPCDIRPTPTGRLIVEAAAGRMPGFVDTGLNMVHVDDVAAGHLAAMESGRVGEHYILGGQNATLAEILVTVAALAGKRPPRFKLPRTAIYPVALVAEAVARQTGREPFVTRDALAMSKNHMYFTSVKAKRELGYRARPYYQGIADAIDWFRAAGYLSR